MNNQESLGYSESPKNGLNIIRARTTGQLRLWKIPRDQQAVEALYAEFGRQDFPGLYILLDKKKAYVGETKNLYNRMSTHVKTPERKIEGWAEAIIISDGRIATLSDFNDTVVRLALEYHINMLLKSNRFELKSQTEEQTPTASQMQTIRQLQKEIEFILLRQTIIQKLPSKIGLEEILPDALKKILIKKGHAVDEKSWSAKEATVDKNKVFIRPGSEKKKGWQITFRDLFKKALQDRKGFLLIPRGGVFLIPLSEVRAVIPEDSVFKQNTIDLYVNYELDGKVSISYKKNSKDITDFNIQ